MLGKNEPMRGKVRNLLSNREKKTDVCLSLVKDKQTNTLQIYCLSLEKQLILLVFVKGGIEILPYLCDII